MPDVSHLNALEAVLKRGQREMLDAVKVRTAESGLPAYLVGGAVRDWLLGLSTIDDLDVAVVGDAVDLAESLRARYGGDVQTHARFNTATWTLGETSIDLAMARHETYARPAALPTVAPSNIGIDLRRRDFTINAMAFRLGDGTFIDPYGGYADLQAGRLRILHPVSFIDDPTRLFRGARYSARFGFALERVTRAALDTGLPHLRALSGERVKYDLELIFIESRAENAISLLMRWGVFRAMGLPVPDLERMISRFERTRQAIAQGTWPVETLGMRPSEVLQAAGWGALVYNAGQLGVSRLIEWIPFDGPVRDALVALGALATINAALFQARKSVQSQLLREFSGLTLFLGYLFDSSASKRDAMLSEWRDWRKVKPVTTGDTLKARGLAPGPAYARILDRLRQAWLDNEVTSQADELQLLDRLLIDPALW